MNPQEYLEGDEFSQSIRIPKERVAVIIGKSGQTKKELEAAIGCSLDIDSQEGEVKISSQDSYKILISKDVIKAIARGFNPDIAKILVKDSNSLELINLADYNSNKNHQPRLKGRVIGRDGKARKIIEEHTECSISVYGKTIGIIGEAERVRVAYKAVNSLLEGSPHSQVYKWLEKQKFLLQKTEMFGSEKIELKENVDSENDVETEDKSEKRHEEE